MLMKTLLITLCLLAPITANAACAPTDFVVKDFAVSARQSGMRSTMIMKGELVNNCATPAAAQVEIDARDANGKVLQSRKGWPAGTTNIAPGKSVPFNLGRMFHYQASMQTYAVRVVSVRTW